MCILVVKDEFLIREIARVYLEDAGYEVLTADRGSEAVKHIVEYPERFICLVTDYYMPGGFHGGQVIEHMRQSYPEIPMILASANPRVTTQEWRDHYRVAVLGKPYFPEELVELVRAGLH